MKRILLIAFLLTISSCAELTEEMFCQEPSESKREEAKNLLGQWSTFREPNISEVKAKAIFGCHYRRGDAIYSSKALWSTYYVLVRYGKAVTYVERSNSSR